MTLVVETRSLKFSYQKDVVFSYSDITLSQGDVLFVLGRSGSGKSTLLNLLAGFLTPLTGEITINGTALHQLSPSKRDVFRGRNIGIVFQKNVFLRSVSIWENLKWASYAADISFDAAHAEFLLGKLGISEKKHKKPHQLSQGEQQRASIARALVNRPKLVLADEPTSALDDHNAQEVIDLLKSAARQQNASLIVVTHDRRIVNSDDAVYHISQ